MTASRQTSIPTLPAVLSGKPFGYCMNTSTIHGHGLSLTDEVDLVARAGFDAIEPWIRELDEYAKAGGSLEDLGKRIAGAGLRVPNLIGFFEWVVDDDAVRAKGLAEARRNFDMARRIGCERLAAPPFGAHQTAGLDLMKAAERYRVLLEMGAEYGVVPMVEFWGVAKSLSHLGEAMLVAIESGRPEACVLADVFHIYKGGTSHTMLRLLGPHTLGLLHINDYPADPPWAAIGDPLRVFPGDGVAPLVEILRDLHEVGWRGMLSLELFNESYYRMPAAEVARVGLEKMRAVVAKALAE